MSEVINKQETAAQREERSSEKMGTMPVGKLLFSMAAPMVIAMIVQALYNVVDSIFVAQISENALTAVSLAFPMQMLIIAVSTGIGVGTNAALSRSLGEGDAKRAGRIALNGLFLSLIGCMIFLVFGIFGAGPFMSAQKPANASPADIAEIVSGGTQYLSICAICSFCIYFEIAFERLLQATGRTVETLISQGSGAVVNIILDPIMIFTLDMGVAGAAVATVLGQFVACIIALVFNLKRNKELEFNFKGFRPEWKIVQVILAIGVPSILMQAIGSLMNICMNQILLSFTATAAAVFGVYYKLQSMIFMPIFGLNNGMVPIVSYNYGARNRERIIKTIKLAMIYAVSMMMLGIALMQTIPDKMLLLFDASENMLGIGVPALRTLSISFVFAGFCIVTSSVCQALGNGIYSIMISFFRQLVVLLPVAYLMSLSNNVNLVWWSFPIAEIASMTCSVVFLLRINKRVLRPLSV